MLNQASESTVSRKTCGYHARPISCVANSSPPSPNLYVQFSHGRHASPFDSQVSRLPNRSTWPGPHFHIIRIAQKTEESRTNHENNICGCQFYTSWATVVRLLRCHFHGNGACAFKSDWWFSDAVGIVRRLGTWISRSQL